MPKSVQAFSSQKSGQMNHNLLKFHKTLMQCSGNEPNSLLSKYFSSHREGKKIFSIIEPKKYSQFKNVVANIKSRHSCAGNAQKGYWLSLLSNILTRKELLENGFSVSKTQFAHSHRSNLSALPSRGRRCIDDDTKSLVQTYINNNTKQSYNRTVKMKNKEGKKEEVLVQYPKCCVKCLYVNFCRENGNRLSETKFRQLVPKNIKPSRKATDLCPYCEDLPKINKRKRD